MADVRSMLRASREARRINHPHASYTSDGKLLCNLCEAILKSEAAWQSHLHSSSHTLRSSRAKDAAASRPNNGNSRKRKASLSESPSLGERKRSKPAFSPGVEDGDVADAQGPPSPAEIPADVVQQSTNMNGKQITEDEEVDPAALEALERELADLEAVHRQEAIATSGVTISAAPMTANEIAAQAREEQSTQRGKRDAELEEEKDDAARILEDEFEAMEGLDERVRKLREKREALRKNSHGADQSVRPENLSAQPALGSDNSLKDGGGEDEDDEDDDDFDEWQFGAR